MSIHDTMWAIAFERAVWECLKSGDTRSKAKSTATEYANETLKLYGEAIMSGLPVRR
jgi:hypothetical protein